MRLTKLGDALAVLRQRGWVKNRLQGDQGQVCLVGALNEAYLGSPLDRSLMCEAPPGPSGRQYREDRRLLNEAASQLFPARVSLGAPMWQCVQLNNHPATTVEDVETVVVRALQLTDEGA